MAFEFRYISLRRSIYTVIGLYSLMKMEVLGYMSKMSDDLLIESYLTAKQLKLSPEFLELLESEIARRSLSIQNVS